MKTTTKLFSVLFFIMLFFSFTPDDEGDRLVGIWAPSNGKARVKVEKIGNKYYGKIVWLREPIDPVTQKPKVDKATKFGCVGTSTAAELRINGHRASFIGQSTDIKLVGKQFSSIVGKSL